MKLTKANAAEVAQGLSPLAKKILIAMFSEKKKLPIEPDSIHEYHNAVIELIAREILRADIDLLTGNPVSVLERGGKLVMENLLAAEKEGA